ncbi:MAG TPA: PBP1A family penicillin-binding protein [Geminicoccaceae bacterium]|nr:PBP1A family penicillin-binding protein [Geminicoccaceae bacterium]
MATVARRSTRRRAPARRKGRKARTRTTWPTLRRLLIGPLGAVLLVVGLVWYLSLDLADLKHPVATERQPEITLEDRAGVAFASFGDHYGEYLSLDQISPWLPKAVIAVEDRRFYQHPGLDPIGIGRAFLRNLEAGRVVQGGSTISQQLAKLAFLTPERSLVRKIKEALYSLWIEARFDKEEILELYLNRVYLGSGAYGVDAAARRYFAKPASELSLAESAMLAGLIRAPSRYAPTRDLALAQTRAEVVLSSMAEIGLITAADAEAARAAPAGLAAPRTRAGTGYFADWIFAESRLYADAEQPRLVVRTTLDRDLQRAAEDAVQAAFAEAPGRATGAEQAALVAMSPDGRVRAMLGGRAYASSQFNRATQAERQPGSAFKLFVYLAALEAGLRPEDLISAAPIQVNGWAPRNFDDRYPTSISLLDSFVLSVNTAAVRLGEQVGRERVIRLAERLGITSPLRDEPSIALGSSEVRLLELTAAYASVANGGYLVWPEGIETIAGGDGEALYQRRPVDEPVLEPGVVRAMTAMLETTLDRGTGRQAALRRFAAGKTGTSSEHRDAWFVGFTDALVVGVWVGNDDGRPMARVSGGGLPARIFREFILRAQGDLPFRPEPAPPKPREAPVVDAIGDFLGDVMRSLKGLFD